MAQRIPVHHQPCVRLCVCVCFYVCVCVCRRFYDLFGQTSTAEVAHSCEMLEIDEDTKEAEADWRRHPEESHSLFIKRFARIQRHFAKCFCTYLRPSESLAHEN